MAEEQSGERTHEPTPKRLREAREQGDFLQSKELAIAMVSATGLVGLVFLGPWAFDGMLAMLKTGLSIDQTMIREFDPAAVATDLLLKIAAPFVILFAGVSAASLATPAILGSLQFQANLAAPKWSRINPMTGIKRIFGIQGLIELGKALSKALFLGCIGGVIFYLQWSKLGREAGLDPEAQLAAIGNGLTLTLLGMAAALVGIALIDVPVQYVRRRGRLMMTRQQVMDEHKQTEGSPELKAAVRRRQHEILSGSMRKALDTATVVITNPDHFAVALRYRQGMDKAPVIVARARGAAAQAAKAYAKEQAVPLVSHPLLARAIYFTGRNGQMIREDLFSAVAVVLAFVLNVDRHHDLSNVESLATVPEGARFDANGRSLT